jgi:hypothetical protein
MSLSQLPKILEAASGDGAEVHASSGLPPHASQPIQHKPVPFFAQQLTAFHVWLRIGSESRNPPEQLPIVLQVCFDFYRHVIIFFGKSYWVNVAKELKIHEASDFCNPFNVNF